MPGLITEIETECSVDITEPILEDQGTVIKLDFATIMGSEPLPPPPEVIELPSLDKASVVLGILNKQTKLSFFRLVQKHDKVQPETEQAAFGTLCEGTVTDRAHVGDKTQFNGAVLGSIYYLVDDGSTLHVVVSKEQLLAMQDTDIARVCQQASSGYIGVKSMRYLGKDCFSKQFVYDKLWKKLKRAGHTF